MRTRSGKWQKTKGQDWQPRDLDHAKAILQEARVLHPTHEFRLARKAGKNP